MSVLPSVQAYHHNRDCFCQVVHLVLHFLTSIRETVALGHATASGPSASTKGPPPEMQALGELVEGFYGP